MSRSKATSQKPNYRWIPQENEIRVESLQIASSSTRFCTLVRSAKNAYIKPCCASVDTIGCGVHELTNQIAVYSTTILQTYIVMLFQEFWACFSHQILHVRAAPLHSNVQCCVTLHVGKYIPYSTYISPWCIISPPPSSAQCSCIGIGCIYMVYSYICSVRIISPHPCSKQM